MVRLPHPILSVFRVLSRGFRFTKRGTLLSQLPARAPGLCTFFAFLVRRLLISISVTSNSHCRQTCSLLDFWHPPRIRIYKLVLVATRPCNLHSRRLFVAPRFQYSSLSCFHVIRHPSLVWLNPRSHLQPQLHHWHKTVYHIRSCIAS